MQQMKDQDFVADARARLELSRNEFGRKLGVHERTVYRWEIGATKLKQHHRIAIRQVVLHMLGSLPKSWGSENAA